MLKEQSNTETQEYFCNESYYDMYTVRRKTDRNFNSEYLFHLIGAEEAKNLCKLLNDNGIK